MKIEFCLHTFCLTLAFLSFRNYGRQGSLTKKMFAQLWPQLHIWKQRETGLHKMYMYNAQKIANGAKNLLSDVEQLED